MALDLVPQTGVVYGDGGLSWEAVLHAVRAGADGEEDGEEEAEEEEAEEEAPPPQSPATKKKKVAAAARKPVAKPGAKPRKARKV